MTTRAKELGEALTAALLNRPHWGDADLNRLMDKSGHEMAHALSDADKVQTERDAARAEVEQLRAELAECRETIASARDLMRPHLATGPNCPPLLEAVALMCKQATEDMEEIKRLTADLAAEKQGADFEHHNATIAQRAKVDLEGEVENLRTELRGAQAELHAAGTVIVKLRDEANEQRARAEAAEAAIEQAKLDPTCWWCKGHYPSAEEWEKHLPGCKAHPFAGALGKLAAVTMWLGKWGMHEIGTADFWHAMEELGLVPEAGR